MKYDILKVPPMLAMPGRNILLIQGEHRLMSSDDVFSHLNLSQSALVCALNLIDSRLERLHGMGHNICRYLLRRILSRDLHTIETRIIA